MTDDKNEAIQPMVLEDEQLEEAVGGRMAVPKGRGPKPRTEDPCAGGE